MNKKTNFFLYLFSAFFFLFFFFLLTLGFNITPPVPVMDESVGLAVGHTSLIGCPPAFFLLDGVTSSGEGCFSSAALYL